MDKQIERAMLNHVVSYEPFVRYDGRGQPEYSAAKSSPCYLTSDMKMVRNMNGEEVVSNLTIFFTGTDAERIGLASNGGGGQLGTVNPEAHMGRLTLPNGRQPPILGVLPYYDFMGKLNYAEVHL